MTKLVWDSVGDRMFEAGVDRGVLFVNPELGVAWIGLLAVNETPTGGEARPFYIDGVKFANRTSMEEFEATIEAYFSPEEFDVCDGTAQLFNGLHAGQQKRKPFSLAYRTRIGNDVDNTQHAYKIHLVYNALAAPTDRSHETLSDQVKPSTLSWKITTLPGELTDFLPTSHFIIDSRDASAELLQTLEDTLYGTESSSPTLPTPAELLTMFEAFAVFMVTITGTETFAISGTGVEDEGSGQFALDDARVVDNGDGTYDILEET